MIFAVEESIKDVTKGANMMEVIQNNYRGQLDLTLLSVALLGQTWKVLPKILLKAKQKHIKCYNLQKTYSNTIT